MVTHCLVVELLPDERGPGIIDFLDRGIMLVRRWFSMVEATSTADTPKGNEGLGGISLRRAPPLPPPPLPLTLLLESERDGGSSAWSSIRRRRGTLG